MTILANRQAFPSPQEAAVARISGRRLARYVKETGPLALRIPGAEQDVTIELPSPAVAALMEVLEVMAAGHGVTVVAENAELTSAQAAEVLSVSRPFLVRLLEARAIPHRKVGKHRRVRLDDILAYKSAIDREREAVLDELAREAQAQGMGYDRP